MEDITLAKTPLFYQFGNEEWITIDGVKYTGCAGHFNVIEEGVRTPENDPMFPVMLDSVDNAVGHLKNALESGFELVYLNLRPGLHHVVRKQ